MSRTLDGLRYCRWCKDVRTCQGHWNTDTCEFCAKMVGDCAGHEHWPSCPKVQPITPTGVNACTCDMTVPQVAEVYHGSPGHTVIRNVSGRLENAKASLNMSVRRGGVYEPVTLVQIVRSGSDRADTYLQLTNGQRVALIIALGGTVSS